MLVELLPFLGIIVAAYAVQTSTGFGAGEDDLGGVARAGEHRLGLTALGLPADGRRDVRGLLGAVGARRRTPQAGVRCVGAAARRRRAHRDAPPCPLPHSL
ncbi:MAG: hypothetical protein ACJA00_003428 [Myxococcota bacterium]|jgi:hypothetical protein